jgi:hypothetical protein
VHAREPKAANNMISLFLYLLTGYSERDVSQVLLALSV